MSPSWLLPAALGERARVLFNPSKRGGCIWGGSQTGSLLRGSGSELTLAQPRWEQPSADLDCAVLPPAGGDVLCS